MHFLQLANYDVKGLFEKAAKFMFMNEMCIMNSFKYDDTPRTRKR